jgi:hypothetical protein
MSNQDIIILARTSISTVESNPVATKEDVLTALNFTKRLRELAKELSDQAEAASIAWIQANGEIIDGDIRFYVAVNKTHKCKDVKATLAALLEKSGGDLDSVTECMSTNAWKPGETKKRLGDDADKFFETIEAADLKTGIGAKRLQKVDQKFIKA